MNDHADMDHREVDDHGVLVSEVVCDVTAFGVLV
jgi:hypothetical protein